MTDQRTAAMAHTVNINYQRALGLWQATCLSCGWTGAYTGYQAWAAREAGKHVTASRPE